ncbi:MAG: aspartate dehydrogenase [Deltaproteobacteria bacterium]|nr:MAG: aspartate dehydrogenase [Deltaproteobacteria bacterium]
MIRIGLVGAGAIGSRIARLIDGGGLPAHLVALHDLDGPKGERLLRALKTPPPFSTLPEVVEAADLVVEAASQQALRDLFPLVVEGGKDILVLSVGALLDLEAWLERARERGCRVHIPSGAIAGLDGLESALRGKVTTVRLVSRKPVRALRGSPYVVNRKIRLEELTEETVIFEGSAREACRAFPATANVAATLSLSGIGADQTFVAVHAVPEGNCNRHEIEVRGDFGMMRIVVENVPAPDNPRTSMLAALSAEAALIRICGGEKE